VDCPRGCTHGESEPECALDDAVAEGRVEAERVESFRRLLASRERTDGD
jgi:ribosome biogenesis GTPase